MSALAEAQAPTLTVRRRRLLQRRVRLLVAVVIGYNVLEALVALTAGMASSSTALVSFGLDLCVLCG